MTAITVVGSTGRVGSAVAKHLAHEFDVRAVRRRAGEELSSFATRTVIGTNIVINAAGAAHVRRTGPDPANGLYDGNIALPAALAQASLSAGVSLIHVSSVKAETPDVSAYATSKRAGDDALEAQFGSPFAAAGLSLVVVRPPALLFPPLDAGKVQHLRFLGRVPPVLVPAVRLPVLAPGTFLEAVESMVRCLLGGNAPSGISIQRFSRDERGTLRDIANAFRSSL